MSKLDELIKEYCPDGVEYKAIGDIATEIYRGSGIKRDEVTDDGIPCVRYGEIYTSYNLWFDKCISHTNLDIISNPKFFEKGDILFAITGESVEEIAKSIAYIGDEKCLAGGDIVVLKHNQDPKYLSYALSTVNAQLQKSKGKVKSKVVHSSVPAIKELVLPVPPLEVQREIVRVLDKFTLLTAELTAELTARKKQYEYYRNHLLSFSTNVVWKTLGDIGKVSMCKRIMKNETSSEGDVPFYKIGTFGKKADAYISRATFEKYKTHYSYPNKGDILISAAGTIGRTVVFDGEPAYFQDSNIVWVANDESQVLNEFLYYWYQTSPWKASSGGTIARLYNDNISGAKVPVLPIETQKRLVYSLNHFDAVCNDLNIGLPAEIDARQKQYEYYRDALLTFVEKGETILTEQNRTEQNRTEQNRTEQNRTEQNR
nr:restriction endonuclease subunit S [Eubacterium sp.]